MTDLCPKCHESRRKWRLVEYNPRHPSEWPGTPNPIMDARTTHEQRRADWVRKTAAHIAHVEEICAANHQTRTTEGETSDRAGLEATWSS